ncbi:uncharacterized protein LOC111295763 isoform X2 [Durio zibethinus]|uniref:Uncharacterized protein LOC111295763 isoform X2 n=1 Tax=Durio zibethinus TaxID=66656 RepID=A0A6P5YXF6_DURZI|nr:uncharacterized protein LOC111295763 isoform X2 [Durio zibethinus]
MWRSKHQRTLIGKGWLSFWSPMRLAKSLPLFVALSMKLTPLCRPNSAREPEPIDWEYHRKGIGSRVVDMYKEAYDSVEIPKFVDTGTPQYKPKFDALKNGFIRSGYHKTRFI